MSWNGIKKHTNNANIKAWCEDMDIKYYTINSQGEIDVDGSVDLSNLSKMEFKKLPYKFGKVKGYFDLSGNLNLTSLNNCPDYVGNFFACDFCPQLDSLEGCPTDVGGRFYCKNCKREFTKKEVKSL